MQLCAKCYNTEKIDEDGCCGVCHADDWIESRDLFVSQLGLNFISYRIPNKLEAILIVRKLLTDLQGRKNTVVKQGKGDKGDYDLTLSDISDENVINLLTEKLMESVDFILRFDDPDESEVLFTNKLYSLVKLCQ